MQTEENQGATRAVLENHGSDHKPGRKPVGTWNRQLSPTGCGDLLKLSFGVVIVLSPQKNRIGVCMSPLLAAGGASTGLCALSSAAGRGRRGARLSRRPLPADGPDPHRPHPPGLWQRAARRPPRPRGDALHRRRRPLLGRSLRECGAVWGTLPRFTCPPCPHPPPHSPGLRRP